MDRKQGSLDANILLRLIVRDIPEQSDSALELIDQGKRFHVADTAIIETIFVLERYYQIPRTEIADIMQVLMGHSKLDLNSELFRKAMELFVQHSKLSIEDCCLAIYAQLNNALPLWTFDRKLANQVDGVVQLLR